MEIIVYIMDYLIANLFLLQTVLTNNANNTRNIWKGIKSIINIQNNIKTQSTSLLIDDQMIQLVNELN